MIQMQGNWQPATNFQIHTNQQSPRAAGMGKYTPKWHSVAPGRLFIWLLERSLLKMLYTDGDKILSRNDFNHRPSSPDNRILYNNAGCKSLSQFMFWKASFILLTFIISMRNNTCVFKYNTAWSYQANCCFLMQSMSAEVTDLSPSAKKQYYSIFSRRRNNWVY